MINNKIWIALLNSVPLLSSGQQLLEQESDKSYDSVWGKMNWKDKIDNNQQPVIGVFTQTLEDFM